jgi:hypothetical protein
MTQSSAKVRRRFPDDYMLGELHAIARRALAQGDEYRRELLRDQVIGGELAVPPLNET